jgi:biotin carboxyl carrier protein
MWKHGLEKPPAEVALRTLEDVQRERDLVNRALQHARASPKGFAATIGGAPPASAPAQAAGRPHAALQVFDVYVNGEYFRVEVGPGAQPGLLAGGAPAVVPAPASGPAPAAAPSGSMAAGVSPAGPPSAATAAAPAAGTVVTAPLPGMVVGYKKRPGEPVRAGETVVVLEAMKMHNNIEAPVDGTLAEIHCREGDSVPKGQALFRIV